MERGPTRKGERGLLPHKLADGMHTQRIGRPRCSRPGTTCKSIVPKMVLVQMETRGPTLGKSRYTM